MSPAGIFSVHRTKLSIGFPPVLQLISSPRTLNRSSNYLWGAHTTSIALNRAQDIRGQGRPGGVAGRKVGIVWFRSDLRLHDNESLNRASTECTSILPVYCFDPREYGRSPQGYDRTGPYRASFLIQAVTDLKNRLQSAGADLVVRIGRPEEVIPELARKVGASAVYAHREVTYEEVKVESNVVEALKREANIQFHAFWTNTLHHFEDLPFKIADMPQNFDRFRTAVSRLTARTALKALDRLPGLPAGAQLSPICGDLGDIPTLEKLGIAPLPETSSAVDKDGDCVGGESEGLRQLRQFLSSMTGSTKRSTNNRSHASSFSSSIAPWLATGCLSPRHFLEEAEKSFSSSEAVDGEGAGSTGTSSLQWIQFELLWRDFFRFLTHRHAQVVLPRCCHGCAVAS